MEPIKNLFSKLPARPKGGSERGDLLFFFAKKMHMKIPRIARHLSHLTELKDLYFLKSDCEQAERRGVPFGAAFWTAIRPPKKDL